MNQLNRDLEAIQPLERQRFEVISRPEIFGSRIQNKELEATINAHSPEGIAEAEKLKVGRFGVRFGHFSMDFLQAQAIRPMRDASREDEDAIEKPMTYSDPSILYNMR